MESKCREAYHEVVRKEEGGKGRQSRERTNGVGEEMRRGIWK